MSADLSNCLVAMFNSSTSLITNAINGQETETVSFAPHPHNLLPQDPSQYCPLISFWAFLVIIFPPNFLHFPSKSHICPVLLCYILLSSVALHWPQYPSCLRPVFARSDAGIVASNPTRGMDVCVCVYSVFVLSCV
jgi:hypothetical protein